MPGEKIPVPPIRVKIDRLTDYEGGKTKAFASVTIGGAFAVHGVRVINSQKGLFVQMPQSSYQKNGKTEYTPIANPVTAEARAKLNEAVLSAYRQETGMTENTTGDFSEDPGLPFNQTM